VSRWTAGATSIRWAWWGTTPSPAGCPSRGDNPAAVLLAVASRTAPSLASVAPEVPRPLVEVIDRCLRKNPAERFATGEELAETLGRAIEKVGPASAGTTPDRIIPVERAEAIWLRAAQLQADAATRLEQRSRQGTGLTGITSALPTGGYRLRDVEAAAQEVGIAPEFVALALAEQPAPNAPAVAVTGTRQDRLTTRLLGTSERSLSVSRVIRGTPRSVLEAIGRVCPARPYLMSLRDTVGGHPLDGGVLVFSVPNMMKTMVAGSTESYTPFTYRMYQLELFQLNVTLRPLPAGGGCEVTIYGDLRSGLRKNLKADGWIAAALAATGGTVGTAAGATGMGAGHAGVPPGSGGRGRDGRRQPALVPLAVPLCAPQGHGGAGRAARGPSRGSSDPRASSGSCPRWIRARYTGLPATTAAWAASSPPSGSATPARGRPPWTTNRSSPSSATPAATSCRCGSSPGTARK
jgi:hypothetical protein